MKRACWRYAVAPLAWLVLSAQGPNPKTGAEQREATQQQTNSTPTVSRLPIEPIESVQGARTERPCKPGYDDRSSELCAQWKAADAAAEAAYWARLAFVLGLFGTVGLFWTLLYTRRAVKVAVESSQDAEQALAIAARNADAAAEQVRISEETAKRQLRAYVGVEEIAATFVKSAVENYWLPQIVWKNTGATPAFDVIQGAHWIEVERELPSDFDFPADRTDPDPTSTLAPQQGVTSVARGISWPQIRAASDQESRLFIWGWADYSDIFPGTPRRRTECAFEIVVEQVRGGYGVSFTPLDRHNGMDFNCMKEPKKRA